MRAYSEIFKALGDETRLKMLGLLFSCGELCVCDFEAVLAISQSKASRHLRYLRNAGLVADQRVGVWVYYRVATTTTDAAKEVLAAVASIAVSAVDGEMKASLSAWMEKKKEMQACGETLRTAGEERQ